jgi:glycosyltransferase involved in cell wall biosynthesis
MYFLAWQGCCDAIMEFSDSMPTLRYALIGDGQSPHLLKWARALASSPGIELWVASSRAFLDDFDNFVPSKRRLALDTNPTPGGGNIALLRKLPVLGEWLRRVDADWLHAHYLTSHGTLAWLAKRAFRLRGRIVGSAWGSDILVAPHRSLVYRWVTRRVLRACALTTSDSIYMAQSMHELGATEVMTFPFGLEEMPLEMGPKEPWLFFANRGLEPLYRPERVLATFASVAAVHADARLVVANEGSLTLGLPTAARALGLTVGSVDAGHQVQFVGRLDRQTQARAYARARWYISLPESDSVSVSVLEAMAQGCMPLLSDLPANRELVRDGVNGLIIRDTQALPVANLEALLADADRIAQDNRAWVARHGLFAPEVGRFLARLHQIAAS